MNKRAKRVLALVLALAMMLQQTSIGSAAAETETEPVSEVVAVQETGTEAETQIGTENGSEKLTEAATPAEQDAQSETDASEQSETEDPAETETAAETSEPATEPAAETEKTTEAAAESEPDTTAETELTSAAETDAETESESETDAEAGPTLLNASYNGVGVSVSAAPGVLEAGTTLEMLPVAKSRPYQTLMASLEEGKEINKDKFLSYDIRLVKDGQEVQPNGEVTVTFVNVPFAAEENEEMIVAHLQENAAANTGINTVAFYGATTASVAEMKTGLSITTTHFSTYLVAVLKEAIEAEPNKGWSENAKNMAEKLRDDMPSKYEPQNHYYFSDGEGAEALLDFAAFDFHIFANDVEVQNGVHTNGNIAAENYYGSGTSFGNNQNNGEKQEDGQAKDHVEEYNYFGTYAEGVGNVAGGTVVVGEKVAVEALTDGRIKIGNNATEQSQDKFQAKVYREDEKYIDINQELKDLAEFSVKLVNIADSVNEGKTDEQIGVQQLPTSSSDKYVLNVSGTNKTIYYNMSWEELIAHKWDITGLENQTLIINVNMAGAPANALANLNIESLNGYKNDENVVYNNCNLLWNFYTREEGGNGEVKAYESPKTGEYTEVSVGGTFMGTILAPKANIQFGAVNGSVIATKARHTNAESHKWTFTGLSASVTVTKMLDDPDLTGPKTFYFGIFNDDDQIVPGQRVRSVTIVPPANSASVTFRNLKRGMQYRIYETDENGKPYLTGNTDDGYYITGDGAFTVPENVDDAAVTIKNSKQKEKDGSLTVTKTVAGPGDTEKEFTFTVTLNDTAINGTYGDMTFTNGVATFMLHHGESITATKLPKGITYTVEETNIDGYTVTSTGRTGEITAGGSATAAFTNTRDTGSLKVSKTVTGDAGDTEKEFTFTVTLNDTSINGTYGEMTFANGVATFTLKNDESKTATGLPTNIEYTVVETEANQGNYTTTVTSGTGTITKNVVAEASFVNHRGVGDLEVSKTVTGTGDTTKDFNFTVTLTDASINGTYGEMTFTNGVATFPLKHGESKKATGLPVGVGYTVTEDEVKHYTTTKTGESGTITEGVTQNASFTNDRGSGNLEVKKVVLGNAGDKEKLFDFKVTLDDKTINGTYGHMTFTNGVATFTLKHNETKRATGLPEGITYRVEEIGAYDDGYTRHVSSGVTQALIKKNETKTVVFENTKTSLASLTVSKIVVGNAGSTTEQFHFKVVLKDAFAVKDATYGDMTFTGGVAEFYLKDGESKTATDLPVGLTYTVTETDANQGGYTTTYSGTTTAGPATGTLESGKTAEVTVTNTKYKISLIKKDEGGKVLPSATFELYKDDGIFKKDLSTDNNGMIVVDDGTITPGTYYFVETQAPEGYVTPDEAYAKSSEITIKDDGTITPDTATVEMENQEELEVKFSGKKTVEGIASTDKVFTFNLYKTDETYAVAEGAPTLNTVSTFGTINGSQEFEFTETRTYNKPITEFFVVKEVAGTEAGFTYDSTVYKIKVVVAFDENGKLTKTVTVNEQTRTSGNADGLDFTNKYSEKGTVQFHVKKTFTKGQKDKTFPKDGFTFTLEGKDGAPMPKVGESAVQNTVTVKTADEVGIFGKITFTEDGTYTYTIQEVIPKDKLGGVTYDTSKYTITVTVGKGQNEDGKKSVDVSWQKGDESYTTGNNTALFANTYEASDASITFKGTKFLKGIDSTSKVFTFELYELSKDDVDHGKYDLSKAGDPIDTVSTSGTIQGSQEYSFKELTYKEEGTFYYVVKEKALDAAEGFLIDKKEYLIEVVVKDDDNGKLVATATEHYKALNFTNEYSTEDAKVNFEGAKFVEGTESTDKVFTFGLFETDESFAVADGAAPLQSVSTSGTIKGSQDYAFAELTYTEEGTHYYVVKEAVPDEKDGFTYDTTVYQITVKVEDNGRGNLVATTSGASVGALNFTNEYKAEEAELTFSGTKFIKGIGSTDLEFTFELYETDESYAVAEDAAPLQSVSTSGTIQGSQDYSFGKLTYTEAGTHYYVVKEKAQDAVNGFTFDDTVYTVKVDVTDDGKGTLTAEADQAVDAFDFTNSYETTDADITFGGTKFVEGTESTDQVFTFALYETDETFAAAEGAAPLQSVSTSGTITGSQDYTFAELTYTAEGTHYYVVKETVAEEAPGFTYDTTVYEITVTVTDDGNGNLVAKADVDEKALDFTNTYAAEGTLSLEAVKTMADPADTLGTFQFEVKDENGNTVATASNGADGRILFQNIVTYTAADAGKTFTYTVSEVQPEKPDGYVYDTKVYTVNVTVADNGDGTLKVDAVIDGADTMSFVNDQTHVSIRKVDEEGSALAGARLVIKSEDGKAVESWTTDGNAHDITGLPAGSYTLSEVEAPEGYEISEDVKFEVTGQSAGTIEVVMTDTRKPEEFRGSISVTKMQVDQDGMAIGGQEATFYVALFEDAAKTKRVSPVKAVHFGSMSLTSTAALFENLGAGTYYVSETDEVGNPIESGLYGEVLFWADYPNGDTVTLETDTFSGQLNFNNQFYELPPGYMYMGELQITKAVQKRIKKGSQETTEEYPMTGVFYAGIFNDPEYTDLYGMVPIEVNGTSSSTVVIELPVSEDPGVLKRTYYVTEVDENGIPLVNGNELGFVFDVNGSGTGTTVEVSSDSTVEYATITNTYLEEIESEIITETETVKETTPETTATKAAKTGDETNYWIYLFLLLMSAGTAVVVTEEKRRAKKNRK